MKRSGLLATTKDELEEKIRLRLADNYIFNMAYSDEYGTMKFNTVINFYLEDVSGWEKLLISLEYKPQDKLVRLITMF